MHRLNPPNLAFLDVFQECVSKIREPGKSFLTAEENSAVLLARGYVDLAVSQRLHLSEPHVSHEAYGRDCYINLYTSHLLNQESDLRRHYDRLKAVRLIARCPYCSWAQINHLDHFLPKKEYFKFSVLPENLVPCCSDCNTAKGSYFGQTRSTSLLHPFFEDIPNDSWLGVSASLSPTFSIKYFIDSTNIGLQDAARIENHLTKLKVLESYECLAVEHLISLRQQFIDLLDAVGAAGLRQHMEDIRRQAFVEARSNQNSWKFVLYGEFLSNADFVNRQKLASFLPQT